MSKLKNYTLTQPHVGLLTQDFVYSIPILKMSKGKASVLSGLGIFQDLNPFKALVLIEEFNKILLGDVIFVSSDEYALHILLFHLTLLQHQKA